jgi:peptide/nickel transport system ATP-binding protein
LEGLIVTGNPRVPGTVRAGAWLIGLLILREEMSLTILFISHDLPAVAYLCDRIAVLHQGRILEEAETERFLKHPRQGYSRRLVAAWRG